MPDETPSWLIPYPLPDDPVADYPAVGRDLAETVDAQIARLTAQDTAARVMHADDFSGMTVNPGAWVYSAIAGLTLVPGQYVMRMGATLVMPQAGALWCLGMMYNGPPGGLAWQSQAIAVQANSVGSHGGNIPVHVEIWAQWVQAPNTSLLFCVLNQGTVAGSALGIYFEADPAGGRGGNALGAESKPADEGLGGFHPVNPFPFVEGVPLPPPPPLTLGGE